MIEYELKKSRKAKRLVITVRHTGKVVATVPWFVSASRADTFIQSKTDWILKTQAALAKKHANKKPLVQTAAEFKNEKHASLEFIKSRIEHYNSFYNYPINSIKVKNITSRWGSCSTKKNLNFNYKIFHLPQDLADYIVVHELCHLKQMNHSSKFWDLVAKTIPDYKIRRRILKKNYITILD